MPTVGKEFGTLKATSVAPPRLLAQMPCADLGKAAKFQSILEHNADTDTAVTATVAAKCNENLRQGSFRLQVSLELTTNPLCQRAHGVSTHVVQNSPDISGMHSTMMPIRLCPEISLGFKKMCHTEEEHNTLGWQPQSLPHCMKSETPIHVLSFVELLDRWACAKGPDRCQTVTTQSQNLNLCVQR